MNRASTGVHSSDQARREASEGRPKMWAIVLPICGTTQPLVRNRSSGLIRQRSIEPEGWKIVPVAARKRVMARLESNSTRASAAPGDKEDIPSFERLPSAKEVISREPLAAGHLLTPEPKIKSFEVYVDV